MKIFSVWFQENQLVMLHVISFKDGMLQRYNNVMVEINQILTKIGNLNQVEKAKENIDFPFLVPKSYSICDPCLKTNNLTTFANCQVIKHRHIFYCNILTLKSGPSKQQYMECRVSHYRRFNSFGVHSCHWEFRTFYLHVHK